MGAAIRERDGRHRHLRIPDPTPEEIRLRPDAIHRTAEAWIIGRTCPRHDCGVSATRAAVDYLGRVALASIREVSR